MKRFAVYFAPRPGPFAALAAEWLGWDAATGQPIAQPDIPGVAEITADPRKYGFHATLRAPFRLGQGVTLDDVKDCLNRLTTRLYPARCEGLRLVNHEGFLALVPLGDDREIKSLCTEVVAATNGLRAPLTEPELARRKPENLTPRQRDLLASFGYPYVLEQFQFHMTLTGRLTQDQSAKVAALLEPRFAPVLPEPFMIEDLCLFGEDAVGRFHLLHRYALAG